MLGQAWLAGRSAGFRQSQSSQCPVLVAEGSTSRQRRRFALLQPVGSSAVKDFEYNLRSTIRMFERMFFSSNEEQVSKNNLQDACTIKSAQLQGKCGTSHSGIPPPM